MDARDGTAPAVEAILRSARSRRSPDRSPVEVEARSFSDALASAERDGRVPLIAEVKPTSPTTETVRTADPVRLAREMVDGGAAAISVLTEPEHFGGSTEALARVRESVDVPVLRKDFILRENHLDAVEADLVLLIVRFVDDLPSLLASAKARGFQVLVEVHTAAELQQALAAGARIVGINNRDLDSLSVDLETFEQVAGEAPGDVTLVAESGISDPADVRRMRAAGANALLVGSSIMAGDSRQRTAEFVGAET